MKVSINSNFFKTWTPEMAYLLGYVVSDGSIYGSSRGNYYLEFTSTDLSLIKNAKAILKSGHKISTRERGIWKTSYRIQIGSKEICADLDKLGIRRNKSLNVELPKIPRDYFGDFLRGYLDGDGSVNLGRYFRKDRGKNTWVFTVRFTSGSIVFLKQLHTTLLTRGVRGGYVNNKKRGYDLVFSLHDGIELFKLMYHTEAISSGLFLKRKYDTFHQAFEVMKAGVA